MDDKCNYCIVLTWLGNGRCDHLVLPVQKDKTFVFDTLSVAPKGRHGMVEAGLRYEAVHSMERLKGARSIDKFLSSLVFESCWISTASCLMPICDFCVQTSSSWNRSEFYASRRGSTEPGPGIFRSGWSVTVTVRALYANSRESALRNRAQTSDQSPASAHRWVSPSIALGSGHPALPAPPLQDHSEGVKLLRSFCCRINREDQCCVMLHTI